MSQQATKGNLVDGVEITITPQKVGKDSPITIFSVVLEDKRTKIKGIWHDTFGSKELLRAYLRGLEAGLAMVYQKLITRPEVPFTEL